jgi:mannosyltransferase OCH1-like enzyme
MSIPKLIHQTWKNSEVPENFQLLMNTWKEFHPDWKFILWTDEMNRNFISEHYPDFLNKYDNYPANIQRADAIRYFLLYHYGGVYIDLDFECLQNIEELLTDEECVFGLEPQKHCERFNVEKIICNAFMAVCPSHHFFKQLCTVLSSEEFGEKKTDVLNTTGPFMLTKLYGKYQEKVRIKLLPSFMLYPITIEESREVINGTSDENLETKIQNAYGIHYFWGTWWDILKPNS